VKDVCLLFEGNLDADRIREELLFEGITACDCTFQLRVYEWKQLERTLQGHLKGFSRERAKYLYQGFVDSFSGHKLVVEFSNLTYKESSEPLAGA